MNDYIANYIQKYSNYTFKFKLNICLYIMFLTKNIRKKINQIKKLII